MALLFFLLAFWCSCRQHAVRAGSLADIEHVVLFMQENRAFDHVSSQHNLISKSSAYVEQYFGTMAGVRGFQDPNVQVNDGQSVFYQYVLIHTVNLVMNCGRLFNFSR
jgi:phospholipase C